MGCLFVTAEGIVKPYIIAIDSTHSYQGSWERSMAQIIHMDKGIVPRSGIDTEMQDGVIVIRRVGYLVTDAY